MRAEAKAGPGGPTTAPPEAAGLDSGLRPWLVLFGLSLGVAISNGFARFAYGLILPAMREDLAWSYAEAGWINTANALGYLAGAVLTLASIRRRAPAGLFAIGVIGTTASLLLSGLTEGFWLLTLWRVTAGLFGAPAFIAGGALAASLFADPRRTTLAIALYCGGGGVGMVVSGAALPALFARFGAGAWPASWLGLGATSAAFCALCLWAVRCMAGTAPCGAASASAGVAPAALPRRLPIARMSAALIGYGLFATGYIVYITFLVAWMRDLEASPRLVSATWIAVGLGIVASPFAWRGVLARFANGAPLAFAMLVTALGTLLPIAWPTAWPIAPGLVASGSLFGIAVFMAPAAVTAFSRTNLDPELQASGIALFTVVFAAGQTLGPMAAGAVSDATGSIGHGLASAAAILFLGALIALAQRQLDDRP